MECANVRSLPTNEIKISLLDRLKQASDATEAFKDAVEAEFWMDDANDMLSLYGAQEDASVQDKASVLDMMLYAMG